MLSFFARRVSHILALGAALAAPQCAWAQIEGGDWYSGVIRYNPRKADDHGEQKERLLASSFYGRRDDVLWHAEAAGVVYGRAGNVSLLSASRWGLTDRLELSTYVAEDVLRPSVYVKALWRVFQKRWFLSSRFNIANAYPGMSLAQGAKVERVIEPEADVPLVFELGHEMLLSRAWFTDPNCSDGSAYLILTAGLGLYGGGNFSSADDLRQVRFHFLANRGETLTGSGFRARLKLWADGRLTNRINLHGGIAYHAGTFSSHHAVEIQAEGEYFFTGRWSAKLGFLTSFAHYRGIDSHAAIWPIVDVSYYFGKKSTAGRSSLFKRSVYRGSNY